MTGGRRRGPLAGTVTARLAQSTESEFDVAVVGGGAAGLFVAIRAAEAGARTVLVSRKPLAESSSYWAQGGLAATLAPGDTAEKHTQDTLEAGRDLCRPAVVEVLTREAPAYVAELQARGVQFDTDQEGRLALGLEGGHSARRIVHAGGSETGRAITACLSSVAAADHWPHRPRGSIGHGPAERRIAMRGSHHRRRGGQRPRHRPRHRGRRGAVGAHDQSLGGDRRRGRDGACRRGRVGRPRALPVPSHRAGSARAAGGRQAHHRGRARRGGPAARRPRGAVHRRARPTRPGDSRHPRPDASRRDRPTFGSTYARSRRAGSRTCSPQCRDAGLDPEREPVPVAPASHYLIGGVVTDLDARTNVAGLLAVGECACTGLHGANRLASNSLSECFVFGARAAASARREQPGEPKPPRCPNGVSGRRPRPPEPRSGSTPARCATPRAWSRSPTTLPPRHASSPAPRSSAASPAAPIRRDHPGTDPALDAVHLVLAADGTDPPRALGLAPRQAHFLPLRARTPVRLMDRRYVRTIGC